MPARPVMGMIEDQRSVAVDEQIPGAEETEIKVDVLLHLELHDHRLSGAKLQAKKALQIVVSLFLVNQFGALEFLGQGRGMRCCYWPPRPYCDEGLETPSTWP